MLDHKHNLTYCLGITYYLILNIIILDTKLITPEVSPLEI